jgi:hypothetical protein
MAIATTKKETRTIKKKTPELEYPDLEARKLAMQSIGRLELLSEDIHELEKRLDGMTVSTIPAIVAQPGQDKPVIKKPCPCKDKLNQPVPGPDGGPMIFIRQDPWDGVMIFAYGMAFGIFVAALIVRSFSNGQQNILVRIKELEGQKLA